MNRSRFETVPLFLVAALVALMALCATFLGYAVTQDGERIASIWAANGIALGVLLVMPRKHWAAVLTALVAGFFCANLLINDTISQAAGLAAANGLEVTVGAIAMQRFLGDERAAVSRYWLFRLTLFCGFFACVLSATLASLILTESFSRAAGVFSTYYPAHVIGVVTLTPLVVILLGSRTNMLVEQLGKRFVSIFLITICMTTAIFAQSSVPLIFLTFPMLIYAAFKAEVAGTAVALFLFTLIATALTVRGYGPLGLVDEDAHVQIYFLQFMILVANLTVIPIALAVSDRKLAFIEVAETARKAREASNFKGQFLANMSHEIRTPLNGILGFSELLSSAKLNTGDARKVEMIHSAAESLLQLLNDILDISKVESGQLVVVEEPLNIQSRIEDCAALVEPVAEAKNIAIKTLVNPAMPQWIVGDNLRFRQVLLNLLGNAVKFTSAGEIHIEAKYCDDDQIQIVVLDQGIGIAPERLGKVFDEFVQADNSIAREYGGTGLGLAISRKLAHLMKGDLTLESELGQGTRAIFTIPAIAVSAPPIVQITEENRLQAKSGHILLVDDIEINREVIGSMLENLGHSYVEAANGQLALDCLDESLAANRPFSAVLMDVRMPVMDGLEATRQITMKPDFGHLPVIGLTANSSAEDIEECRAAGMVDVITKPLKIAVLSAALATVLGTLEADKEPSRHDQRKAALKSKYAAKKGTAIARLDQLMQQGKLEGASLAEIADVAHVLAGTAGMFGEVEFGDFAYELETLVRSTIDDQNGCAEEAPVRSAVQKLISTA